MQKGQRLLAFICNESYQVSPSGARRVLSALNCGYGRRLCATVLAAEYEA